MIKREGFNHPIQGGSADMLKLGMINIYYDNPFGFKLLRTLLAVHDEVVVEVHESILDEGVEFIMDCMEKAGKVFQKQIPVKAGKIVLRHWSK
jgi:DNA polymerase-1